MQTFYKQSVTTCSKRTMKGHELSVLTVWNAKTTQSYKLPGGAWSRKFGQSSVKVTHWRGYVHLGGSKFIEVHGVSYDDKPCKRWYFERHMKKRETGL